jgi:hypothetical protein
MFGTLAGIRHRGGREPRHLRQSSGNPTAGSHHAAAPRRQVASPKYWIRAGLRRPREPARAIAAGAAPGRRRSFARSPGVRRAAAGKAWRRLTEKAPLIDSQIEKQLELRGVLDQRRRVQRGPRTGPGARRRSSRRSRCDVRSAGSGVCGLGAGPVDAMVDSVRDTDLRWQLELGGPGFLRSRDERGTALAGSPPRARGAIPRRTNGERAR